MKKQILALVACLLPLAGLLVLSGCKGGEEAGGIPKADPYKSPGSSYSGPKPPPSTQKKGGPPMPGA